MMEDSRTGQRYLEVKHFLTRGVPASLITFVVIITVGYGLMLAVGFWTRTRMREKTCVYSCVCRYSMVRMNRDGSKTRCFATIQLNMFFARHCRDGRGRGRGVVWLNSCQILYPTKTTSPKFSFIAEYDYCYIAIPLQRRQKTSYYLLFFRDKVSSHSQTPASHQSHPNQFTMSNLQALQFIRQIVNRCRAFFQHPPVHLCVALRGKHDLKKAAVSSGDAVLQQRLCCHGGQDCGSGKAQGIWQN